ncbi:MAG: hypothetical protein KAI84_20130, partial [Gammaproteobacteria bacterium]|nr:hypothetical protein [Gammaproteobacteria bacterium]
NLVELISMSQINQDKIEQLNSDADKIIGLSENFFSSILIQREEQIVSTGSRIPAFDGGYQNTGSNYIISESWSKLSPELSELQIELLRKYDLWYENSRFLIRKYLSDRLDAFNESYKNGRKYITLNCPPIDKQSIKSFYKFKQYFNIQQTILSLISSVVEEEKMNNKIIQEMPMGPVGQSSNFIEIDFGDLFYNELRDEINKAYQMRLFTSVMLLSRKLFENLIIEILRMKYPPNIPGNLEIYYLVNDRKFQNFTILLMNIEERKSEFTLDEHLINEIISLIKPFRKGANANAHSIIIVSDEKDISKFDIPRISALLLRLYSNN